MLIKKRMAIVFCLLSLSLLFGCDSTKDNTGYFQDLESESGMNYSLFIPESYQEEKTYPLFIMLHGGTQTARHFAFSTDMNAVAEENEVIVIYPEQSTSRNQQRYWNWFLEENQTRDGLELSLIMEVVDQVMSQYSINSDQVYSMGLSAGAAMALNFAIAYSELIQGVALAAGVPYGVANNAYEAYNAMEGMLPDLNTTVEEAYRLVSQNESEPFKTLVFHGTEDLRVSIENAYFMINQMIDLNDLIDNQVDDDSFLSDSIIEENLFTEENVEYNKTIYFNNNQEPMLALYIVKGMGHVWPGGNPEGFLVDVTAPNMAEIIYDFFIEDEY